MMEQEQFEMQDYQYVNPYQMMYRNMNFQIDEHTSKDTAEKIARQLGFMHNAFGVVAKDLIKVVALRFKEEKCQKQDKDKKERKRDRDREGMKSRKRAHPEDVEEDQVENVGRMRKKVVVSLDSSGEGELLRAGREGGVGFAQKGIDQQPPNSDIFNQFAYKQSGPSESKNTVSQSSRFDAIFKEKLSKIVEEVANKRKKTIQPTVEPIIEQPQISSPRAVNTDEERKQEPSPNGQVTSQTHELKEEQGQAGFLNEFQYRSHQDQERVGEQMHAEEPANRVRMLLEQMDRNDPEPAIEISDDD